MAYHAGSNPVRSGQKSLAAFRTSFSSGVQAAPKNAFEVPVVSFNSGVQSSGDNGLVYHSQQHAGSKYMQNAKGELILRTDTKNDSKSYAGYNTAIAGVGLVAGILDSLDKASYRAVQKKALNENRQRAKDEQVALVDYRKALGNQTTSAYRLKLWSSQKPKVTQSIK